MKVKFESEWVKYGSNVVEGDVIMFLDEGELDLKQENRWVFQVALANNVKKKLGMNKTNMQLVKEVYGDETRDWVGKEVRINKVIVRNPQTGKNVESFQLSAPNRDLLGNVIIQ